LKFEKTDKTKKTAAVVLRDDVGFLQSTLFKRRRKRGQKLSAGYGQIIRDESRATHAQNIYDDAERLRLKRRFCVARSRFVNYFAWKRVFKRRSAQLIYNVKRYSF